MGLPKITFRSATTNTAATVTCGQAFKRGDVPAGSTIAGMQCTPKTTWSDGSLKFAVMAAIAAITGGVPLDIQLSLGTPVAGSDVSLSNLKATGVAATITCGAFGSASWATTDWDSPFMQWVAGPVMSTWIYRKPIGSDPHLVGWLRVNCWANGAVEVLPWIENGYLLVTGPTNKSATYAFTLGGTQRFSLAIDAKHHQRTPLINGVALSYWLGADPGICASHDKDYLQSTEIVPTYRTRRSATGLPRLPTTWSPFDKGGLIYRDNGYGPDRMANPGYQPVIGLLGEHDAAYLFCNDQPELLYGALIRNGFAAGRYPIHYRDETTNRAPALLAYQDLIVDNPAVNGLGGGYYATPAPSGGETTTWDGAHHLSCGYMAYLVTGDFYHLETLQLINAGNFLTINAINNRAGGNRGRFIPDYESVQTRQAAWGMRTLAQAAAVVPDTDTVQRNAVIGVLNTLIDYYHATFVAQPNNQFGVIEPGESNYGSLKDGYTGGMMLAPWQDSFFTMSYGFALAAGMPINSARQTKLSEFFQWKAKLVVGLMGTADKFRFEHFDIYVINITSVGLPNFQTGAGPWVADFKAMYDASVAFETSRGQTWLSPIVDNTINGEYSIDVWPTAVLGNHMPAIAYAKRFGVPGADAAYARVTGATNWPSIQSYFANAPVWDVVASDATPAPVVVGPVFSGPTSIFDIDPTGPNVIFDEYQGQGRPLSTIPTGGTDAVSPVRAAMQVGDDPKSEAVINYLAVPTGFAAGGDSSYTSPAGAVTYQIVLDGVPQPQATDTIGSINPGIRTVSIILGDSAIPRANMIGLSVSFHDEPSPNLTTTAKYQSGVQTTDANGRLTFNYTSTLPVGGFGLLTVNGPGGYHYNASVAVS